MKGSEVTLMSEFSLDDKEKNLPTGLEILSSQNVDNIDYFGTLSLDEKKEIATGLSTNNKRYSSNENSNLMEISNS